MGARHYVPMLFKDVRFGSYCPLVALSTLMTVNAKAPSNRAIACSLSIRARSSTDAPTIITGCARWLNSSPYARCEVHDDGRTRF